MTVRQTGGHKSYFPKHPIRQAQSQPPKFKTNKLCCKRSYSLKEKTITPYKYWYDTKIQEYTWCIWVNHNIRFVQIIHTHVTKLMNSLPLLSSANILRRVKFNYSMWKIILFLSCLYYINETCARPCILSVASVGAYTYPISNKI